MVEHTHAQVDTRVKYKHSLLHGQESRGCSVPQLLLGLRANPVDGTGLQAS